MNPELESSGWTRRGFVRAAASVCALATVACGSKRNTDPNQARLVVLGGPLTEILYGLGLGDQLVGVDITSVYPSAATELPQLGYYRHVNAEGVLSLSPSLVIHSDKAGPPEALQKLRQAGSTLLEIPDPKDLAGARKRIIDLAAHVDRVDAGATIVASLDTDLAAAAELVERRVSTPRVLFLYARGADTLLVSGRDTIATLMIESAGGRNVIDAFSDFRPLSAEAAIAADPEVIVVPKRGLASIGGIEGLRAQPGLAPTSAAKTGRIVALDDLALLGMGPRTGAVLMELARGLHPELRA